MKANSILSLLAVPALLLAFSAQAYDTKSQIKGGAGSGYNSSAQDMPAPKQRNYAIGDKTRRNLHQLDKAEAGSQGAGGVDRHTVSDKTRRIRL